MKPTVRVSIGGMAFNLEDDAYRVLDDYLKALKRHFSNSPEADEIVTDIESRLSELLQMRVSNPESTISMTDALDIIKIMGSPKDFDDANTEINNTKEGAPNKSINTNLNDPEDKFKKRLYRDLDNKIIGGVCSGLGHYFRIDPTAIRLIFAGLFILTFFFIDRGPSCIVIVLVYAILWIVMPAARTFPQKLSMTGSDPSILNIENRSQPAQKKYRGTGLGTVLGVLLNIVVVILTIITSILLIGIVGSLIWLYFDTEIVGINNYLILFGYNTANFKIAIVLATIIPIIGLLSLFIKILRRSSFTTQTLISFIIGLVIWIGAVAYLGNKGVKFGHSHIEKEMATENVSINTSSDSIYIRLGTEYLDTKPLPNNPVMFSRGDSEKDRQICILPRIRVKDDSTVTNYKVEIRKFDFSENEISAKRKANSLKLDYSLTDSLLVINPTWYGNDTNWNCEYFEIMITKPHNKAVILDSPLKEFYRHNYKNGIRYDYYGYNSGISFY